VKQTTAAVVTGLFRLVIARARSALNSALSSQQLRNSAIASRHPATPP
jgi:hypothetical protein